MKARVSHRISMRPDSSDPNLPVANNGQLEPLGVSVEDSDRDPIAALASPPGTSAIAIIRLSGIGCHEVLRSCLQNFPVDPLIPRHLYLTKFCSAEEILDEPLVAFFPAPHSFTGQDCVEIYCHGGLYIINQILKELRQKGVRSAEPGEFTRRAFLHGKLDLASAEGIKELIDAQSHAQWKAARQLASGQVSTLIDQLREEIIGALAYLEAQIDFPDEGDTAHLDLKQVTVRVRQVQATVDRLLTTYEDGQVAREGLKVALVGEPNAGKSTLLNTLLGRERALVSEQAGTTRDYLEEACLINGRLVQLIDLAGLREGSDKIERLGIQSAIIQAKNADLILFLVPYPNIAQGLKQVDQWSKELSPKASLVVASKADLKSVDHRTNELPPEALELSCLTSAGLGQLRDHLVTIIDGYTKSLDELPLIANERHKEAIIKSQSYLTSYLQQVEEDAYPEVLAFELQGAARALKEVVGAVEQDDLLDRVFGEFCLGK